MWINRLVARNWQHNSQEQNNQNSRRLHCCGDLLRKSVWFDVIRLQTSGTEISRLCGEITDWRSINSAASLCTAQAYRTSCCCWRCCKTNQPMSIYVVYGDLITSPYRFNNANILLLTVYSVFSVIRLGRNTFAIGSFYRVNSSSSSAVSTVIAHLFSVSKIQSETVKHLCSNNILPEPNSKIQVEVA